MVYSMKLSTGRGLDWGLSGWVFYTQKTNPSISAVYLGLRCCGHQSKQKHPDLPLSGHILQLFRENTKMFPSQPRGVISPVSPGSAFSLTYKVPIRHPGQMPISNGSFRCGGSAALLQDTLEGPSTPLYPQSWAQPCYGSLFLQVYPPLPLTKVQLQRIHPLSRRLVVIVCSAKPYHI